MSKLSEDQRRDIITKYKLDNSKSNINKICNDYGITRQYIFKLAKSEAAKDIEKTINESKQQFTKRVDKIIIQILDRIEQEVLEGDKITLSQLSTTLGILYDKSRLENDLSTSNNAININIKVEK